MAHKGHFLCFGELLLRLSAPDRGHLFQEARLDAHFGGAEANVAVALARLGVPSAVASVVPDDVIGDGAVDSLRVHGVDTSRIARKAGRLGLYFMTPGAGLRAASIVYDRAGSVFATAEPEDFDWPALLDGAAWLHLSGIIPAMGPEMVEVGLAAIAAARAAGVRVSFDGNFRGTMWARWCADPGPILARYLAGADLMFGNHRDLSLILGRSLPGATEEQRRAAALAAFEQFPNLQTIASTAREVIAPDHHRLAARIDRRDTAFATPATDVPGIIDRIGTGDAFAAGVLAQIDGDPAEAAATGLALAALKHGTAGDQSLTTARELAAYREGGLDVRR